jgi:hypothetical protein
LKLLDGHVAKSQRILRDLRSIRRLLVGEQLEEEGNLDEASADATGQIGV